MNYSAAELRQKNANWINMQQVSSKTAYTLHATGDATLQSGRIYVALPSTVAMNEETKRKYKII